MTSAACSELARPEPLAGSAPFARGWLVVEHPTAWGRDALRDSGIAPTVVSHVAAAEDRTGLRFLAARRIDGDRRERSGSTRRRVWLAWCEPAHREFRTITVESLEQILEWNLDRLPDGDFPPESEMVTSTMEFICAHSKRDACCAIAGRARAASVPPSLHDVVWECSHLGGHRFAATSLFLPSGRLYGRLANYADDNGTDDADAIVSEPLPSALRGPSYLPENLQAAECAVRVDADLPATEILDVAPFSEPDVIEVTASDGDHWLVVCEPDTFSSPASCGAEEKVRTIWRTRIIERRT